VTPRIASAALAVVAVVVGVTLYLRAGDWAVSAARRRCSVVAALVWIGPAVLLVGVVLVAPAIGTIRTSFLDGDGEAYVALDNYRTILDDDTLRVSLRNSVQWVLLLPVASVGFGLATAVLADRVRYESVVKAVLFFPLAISAVAAGVIWRFMLDYRPPGAPQTGTLNAVVAGLLRRAPIAWLIDRTFNNLALIGTTVWTQAGFAMVILSAALRAIPDDVLEAARLDGASEWRLFREIKLPYLTPTILAVMTTMVVVALKAFDIVYVMTNGAFETDVLATSMYKQLFSDRHLGRASAIATLLMFAVTPLMLLNLRAYRREARARA